MTDPSFALRVPASGPVVTGTPGNVLTFGADGRTVSGQPVSGGGAVDSVFGRDGVVVADPGDYDAGQVDNDSSVAGFTVKDALNALLAALGLNVSGAPAFGFVPTWNGTQAVWQPSGGLSVLSFAINTALYECGQTVVNPAFTASYNVTPTSAVLTNNLNGESKNVVGTPTAFASSVSYTRSTPNQQVTWTLTTSNGNRTTTATWGQKNFWGISTTPANTEAFIESLAGSALATTRAAGFTVNATGANKIYYACPTRYGTPTFTVGGFAGGFILRAGAIAVTNAQGFTENYDLYESTAAGLGSTTVAVS